MRPRQRPPVRPLPATIAAAPHAGKKRKTPHMNRNPDPPGRIHIVGAGGVGRETLDAFFALGWQPAALVLVDDHVSATGVHGVAVRRPYDVTDGVFVVAVADPAARRT